MLWAAMVALAFAAQSTFAAAPAPAIPNACSVHAPWGAPSYSGPAPQLIVLCRSGYVAEFNTQRLVADFVSWSLTASHALGCLPRRNSFAPDPDLPPASRVRPGDYRGSAFDRGHFAPNSDFQWDEKAERESFYMSNMSPQAPHLNEWQWEQLEAATRSWALARGPLIVMTGPIWQDPSATISRRALAVPAAYWKVVISLSTLEIQAYIMRNIPIAKGQLAPFAASLAQIEAQSGLILPLPEGLKQTSISLPWPADFGAFGTHKKRACSSGAA
jgi:endonuclease G